MEAAFLALALGIIRDAIKNPEKKKKLRAVMMKIRDAIDVAFAEN